MEEETRRETATLGGGCFWCLEAAFERLRGVHRVQSGYSGGEVPNPSYREVCSGTTGHAEVVQVTFDPREVGYRELLEVFFTVHDPTTLNRQGADVGTQYRSVIFHHSPEQRDTAAQLMAELETRGVWDNPLVTELVPFERFYPAEEEHREFYRRNPQQGYCRVVIAPKLAKLREVHARLLRHAGE